MATVNGIAVALFNAAAGGYAADMSKNPAAYAAAVGAILEKDLSSDAAFVEHLLSNFGVATTNAVYKDAQTALLGMVAGTGRANATVAAIDFLDGVSISSPYAAIATAFKAKVTAAATFSTANSKELDITKLIAAVTGVDTDVVAANASFAAGAASRDKAVNDLTVEVAGLKAELAATQAAAAAAKTAADAAAAKAAADLAAANATIKLIDDTAFASESAAAAAATKTAADAAKTAADAAAAKAAADLKAAQDKAAADAAALKLITDAAAAKAAQDLAAANNTIKLIDDTAFASESAAAAATQAAADKAAADLKAITDAAAAKAAADLKAAQDQITALQNPAGGNFVLTVDSIAATPLVNDPDVMVGVTGANDAFTGTDASLNGDIIVDGSRTDNDSLTINARAFQTAVTSLNSTITGIERIVVNYDSLAPSTLNLVGVADTPSVTINQLRSGSSALVTVSNVRDGSVINAGTGLAGGMTIDAATTPANANLTLNTGTMTGTATVTTTGTGSITTTGGAAVLALQSANGAINVTKTGAGAVTATSTGSGAVNVTANAATGTVAGQSATGNVSVQANAATIATATATAGTAVVSSTGATTANATGSLITVSAPAATAVNVTGTAGAADAATVSINGAVALGNTNVETITIQGASAATTATLTGGANLVLAGTQNVTVSTTSATLTGRTVTDNVTGTTLVSLTTVAPADLSRVNADTIALVGAAGAGAYSFANGANVSATLNPAGNVSLDINDNNAATTLTGSLNLTLLANTTAQIDVEATGDVIRTLNVTSNVADAGQTALNIIGANTTAINLAGTGNITLAGTTAAASVNATGSSGVLTAATSATLLSVTGGSGADALTLTNAANATVNGGLGNDVITVGGVALVATNSINGGDGTDTLTITNTADVSLASISNIELIGEAAAGAAFTMNADQLNLQSYAFTGSSVVTVNNIGTSLNLSNHSFASTASFVINSAATNPSFGAATPRVITGSNNVDTITGGTGADTLLGGGGSDILIGAAGADALVGGLGDNTYRYTAAAQAPTGETITFNTASTLETIDVTDGANTAITVDLSLVNAGALLTGLDRITIGDADTATFTGAQVTGLTLAVGGATATSTLAVAGSATAANTINLANATVTTAVVTVSGGAAVDTITGTTGADTITGLAGNDVLSGGGGADSIDGGADDDTITGGADADTLTGGAGADAIVLTEAVSTIDTVVINASTTGLTSDSGSVVVTGANNDLGQDTVTGFVVGADVIRIVNATQGAFAHGTNTAVGTANAGATTSTGVAGDYAATVGLVDVNASGAFNNPMDVAITFGTALTEANFEAALQYNVTLVAGGVAFTGGDQADTITGGAGADTIVGGGGADVINVTEGAGTAVDTIIYNLIAQGGDSITGFKTAGADVIQLKDAGAGAFALGVGALSTVGNALEYHETATALTAVGVDLGGGGDTSTGAAIVAVGAGTGTAGVQIWYTTNQAAATTANSTLIATLVGLNTGDIAATDFIGIA